MAAVTDYLFQLIAKQVEDRGLVVWYDPEKAYMQAAADLALPKTAIARYDGSFFSLRHEIDQRLNDGQPPRLVVYVAMSQEETHGALIELEAAGTVVRPGQQPPNRNTKLAVVARNALRPILGDEQVSELEKQVDSGKLSLADLNALADKGKDISTGILSLIFGTANPQDVTLASTINVMTVRSKRRRHRTSFGTSSKSASTSNCRARQLSPISESDWRDTSC